MIARLVWTIEILGRTRTRGRYAGSHVMKVTGCSGREGQARPTSLSMKILLPEAISKHSDIVALTQRTKQRHWKKISS